MADLAQEATGIVIEKQGFMKKVTFFDAIDPNRTGENPEGETVFVSEKGLDIEEDREEIVRLAKEQL